MAEFYDQLVSSHLASVYVLVSTDQLLCTRAMTAIRDAAVPEDLRSFNVDSIDGKGASADQILLAAQTLPMMSTRRLLIVRGLDEVSGTELAKLVDYLEEPNPTTVVLATCTKVDKRIKFFQRAKSKKFLYELSAPKRVGPWIRDEATRQQVLMSSRAADRLADVVGGDLARLELCIQQLALFVGPQEVTVDDIDELIADTRERSVFELTDAIASRSQTRALSAVAGLFEQRQSAIGVVMMLARNMRQLGLCQAGLAEGAGNEALVKRMGIAPFMLSRLRKQANHYSIRALAQSLTLLAEADRALKGFDQRSKTLGKPLAERIIVEELVTALIQLAH